MIRRDDQAVGMETIITTVMLSPDTPRLLLKATTPFPWKKLPTG